MNFDTLLTNLTNPALLFFFMGIIAVRVKSTLSLRILKVYFHLSAVFYWI